MAWALRAVRTDSSRGTPTLKPADAWRFFAPLVLMAELNMVSKSVIHAFLARTAAPELTLAAFNISFTFYYTITSVTELASYLAIAYLDDRRSLRQLLRFLALIVCLPLLLALLAALTGVGDWVFGTLFGASAAVVREAKLTTLIFCLSAPFLLLRGLAFGLLMVNRRTTLITVSTLVRLASLALSLLLWPLVLDGAPVGAASLVTCMAVETCFAVAFAWRHVAALQPRVRGKRTSARALWSFSWPIAISQASELGVVFVVNLFIGRLVQADLALAAFGVVHGLVALIMGPLRNLMQTAQTLVNSRQDVATMVRFSLQLAALFALLAGCLFLTPIAGWILGDAMGLRAELFDYCLPAMRIAFVMALFWALAATCRGLLARARDTRVLARSSFGKLAAACIVGSAVLYQPGLNGALVGLTAWIVAYAVETAVLGHRLRGMSWAS